MARPREVTHQTDICIIGGGMAGVCAAIAAARHGSRVVLMQDRPVLGGNASSEIRMQIGGALGENNLETGILEEIKLENAYRNPGRNYSVWDSVLYGIVRAEKNIEPLLNCSCVEANAIDQEIQSVKGWQLTTYTWHEVQARIFIDCSGDSMLAYLVGANYRVGRESRHKYDEGIGPDVEDERTMGMSCLIQGRELPHPTAFRPPVWANTYRTCEELGQRSHDPNDKHNNYWWIELGGEQDSIHDTEDVRDELLKVAFGVWDHIKNHGDHGAENWALDWVGFLPGKRESRRCLGDHLLTAHDIRQQVRFEDVVAYGGWSMDDHHPGGMRYMGPPTIFHPAPSPYGIPYRCLYSQNIHNLLFAGRNISATHAALSSARVMGTCSVIGQAAGTAAHLCALHHKTPREVYHHLSDELQRLLQDDDCYLPWKSRPTSEMTGTAILAASDGDPEPLRNGVDRPVDGNENCWIGDRNSWITFTLPEATKVSRIRLVLDSDLNREKKSRDNLVSDSFEENLLQGTMASYPLNRKPLAVPPALVRGYLVQWRRENGEWATAIEESNNHQRLLQLPVEFRTDAVRFVPKATWGSDTVRVYSMEVS